MATKGLGLQALRQPLRGGWWFQIRHRACRIPCGEIALLPKGLLGVLREGELPPMAWRTNGRGPSATILETESYRWEIGHEGGERPPGPVPELVGCERFVRDSVDGQLPCGDLRVVNYLGVLGFAIRRGADEQSLAFGVVSKKLSDEADFEKMTSNIAEECDQLLIEWNTPVTVPFSSNPERRRKILLEQFLYLRAVLGGGRLEQWMEAVRRRPHTALVRRSEWRPAALVRSSDHLRNPLLFGRDWRRGAGGQALPSELREVSAHETMDTPPNRFLRHALEAFLAVCDGVGRLEAGSGGPAQEWAAGFASKLNGILGTGFFREVGRPTRLALENQTLQKREGYRDILRTWVKLDQAARLDWEGREDVFGATVRNVANLYEYWLFFKLYEQLKGIAGMRQIACPGTDRMRPAFCKGDGQLTVNLQRGKESVLVFEWEQEGAERLRVHFYYERVYSRGDVLAGGAYSRMFRPDFSLVVFPAVYAEREGDFAEESAARAGQIACLHFDAKYRVDKLEEFFGPSPGSAEAQGELDAEEESKSTNTYKRADLYKMHTYNDAIRRTVGSYVLYPGDAENGEEFRKYHELLPGLGAFAVPPGKPERLRELGNFIERVLLSQSDKFSQLARINYWTHDTVREEPAKYHAGGRAAHAKPPKDASVVLGFLREGDDPEAYRAGGVFFCHAVEWEDTGMPSEDRRAGAPTRLGFDPLRADWLALFQKKITAPWLGKVENVRIVTAAERAAELKRDVSAMKAAYYYRIQFGNGHEEPPRDISPLVGPRPSKPVGCNLAELAKCRPVRLEPKPAPAAG